MILTQQQALVVRWLLTVACSGGVALKIIPQAWADWLNSDATFAVVSGGLGFIVLGWGWWKTRPKAVVASAGTLLEGKGAVIAPSNIADSTSTPANVVKTATEAARLPGVPTV